MLKSISDLSSLAGEIPQTNCVERLRLTRIADLEESRLAQSASASFAPAARPDSPQPPGLRSPLVQSAGSPGQTHLPPGLPGARARLPGSRIGVSFHPEPGEPRAPRSRSRPL